MLAKHKLTDVTTEVCKIDYSIKSTSWIALTNIIIESLKQSVQTIIKSATHTLFDDYDFLKSIW